MKRNFQFKVIILAVLLAIFDFASYAPSVLKDNALVENLKIKNVLADAATQFPATNSVYSGTGFTNPQNLYADDTVNGTSAPPRNGGRGNVYGNFGFDGIIPAGSTINSVNVIYEFRVSTTASVAAQRIKARINGIELANHNNASEPLSYQIVTVNITADRSWARNDFLNSAFEIIAEPRRSNSGTAYTASWDYVKVEVNFTPPPNITSISADNGQIGDAIIISGDHFGIAGNVAINAVAAMVIGPWSDTSLTARIPGQEEAANITGKIQVTRSSDGKTSNLYPADPSNFTILAPSVSGSNPNGAISGQTVMIEFSGAGIDTDIGTSPILKLAKTGETDIIGTAYSKVTDYQAAQATFDLTGAATGYWKMVIINMDGQSGSYGDGTTTGFYISAFAPTVAGINPVFGNNSSIINITSITGTNFQNGASAKLTKTAQADIAPSTAFIFTDSNTLSNGAFDLAGKTAGWWNVVITNPDLQTGSYGNEIDSGFEIRFSKPSNPANIYQFKNNTDAAQPPTTEISVGEGIGQQTTIYFRMDMEGGLIGDLYFPQVEVKPIGGAFECNNLSPSPCAVTTGFFAEGGGVVYNGVAARGWGNIIGVDGEVYHWQARVRNSSGESDWVSFGGNSDPNDIDVYLDNTPPTISPGIDGTCGTAAINITDSNAVIRWNTTDVTSGFEPPPGAGSYGTAQAQYIKTSLFADWISTPGNLSTENPRENSPHQIVLSGLSPDTNYTYRIISKDAVANERRFENCGFLTTASSPIKTVELLIAQETTQNTGTRVSKDFDVYIPESPLGDISIKSAFIEISGISDPALIQTVNVELRRGNGQVFTPAGADYVFSSSGTATPFTILFDALNPPGSGQEDMSNITVGATNYEYTLFLNGAAVTISILSAKLIITYSYAP